MRKRAIFCLIFLILAGGCSYHTTTLLPPHVQSIYVENFKNEIDITAEVGRKVRYRTYRPGLENKATRAIIERFITDGTLMVTERPYADAVLDGELVDYTREPVRYDTNNEVKEYRLTVTVNFHVVDVKSGKTLASGNQFAGDTTYLTSGPYAKDEDAAIDKAVADLARRIVDRTIEVW